MAPLGVRTFDELIGRVDLLEADDAIEHWKARGIDLSHVLHCPDVPDGRAAAPRASRRLAGARRRARLGADRARRAPALEHGEPVAARARRSATSTAPSAACSRAAIAKRARRRRACREGTIRVDAARLGRASRFGAWLAPGVELTLLGDANDYIGKGLSGGVLAVRPPDGVDASRAEENVIVGNTVLYGATAGRAFFRGLAGERFAVRNSGAQRRRRGRRRPRLRVHDRRPRRRARPDRAQLRRRHERRRRLRARRGRRRSAARCNPRARSARAARRGGRRRGPRARRGAPARAPARRSPRACSPTGTRCCRAS